MGYYSNLYSNTLLTLRGVENSIMNGVVNIIKSVAGKPIHIGNHWYYIVKQVYNEVPAYCHESDYDPENPKFLPIYDEESTGEFGWSDFEECCRIFDMINNKLKDTK